MATTADTLARARSKRGRGFMADQRFFTIFAAFLAGFILFGFLQFQLRGYSNFVTAPLFLHLHGAVMVLWLGLYVTQSWLISQGQVAIHRKTGWLSLGVAAAVVGVGSFTGIHAIDVGRVPPFFTPAFFLALTQLGVLAFALVVAWAVARRRDVQWHRRLMIGSGIIIAEPALGRLLPMPLLGQSMGEFAAMVVQLGMIAVLARHDRKLLGSVHPATLALAAITLVTHLGIEVLARTPAFVTLAESIAAG